MPGGLRFVTADVTFARSGLRADVPVEALRAFSRADGPALTLWP